MKTFSIVLLGLARIIWSVESFSTVVSILSPLKKTPVALGVTASQTDDVIVNEATKFWGKPREEQEIINFVSSTLFNTENDEATADQWVEVISAEPPLLVVHGFLERSYCDQIIDATRGPSSSDSDSDSPAKHELKRSTMGAEQDKSDHRTSSTAWLHDDRCPSPLRTFATRASALSGLPTVNMENLQVVRYQPGEEFQLHTDHLDSFNEFGCGGRLCTCLVYLNDSEQSASNNNDAGVSENGVDNGEDDALFTGGETNFPEFDAAIPPTKGSALFFWNTLEKPGSIDYDENMFLNVDIKLRHAGLPVLSGEKWVANRWMHPRDFGADVRGL